MSQWRQCKRPEFVRRLRKLGFEGLFSGTKHRFMVYKESRLTIPSNGNYSAPQLRMMIAEVEQIIGRQISADDWAKLR